MFTKKNPPLSCPSKGSPLSRRRILEYKNSISKSFPLFSSTSHFLRRNHNCKRQTLYPNNSHWTKIRHSLDFIRKTKQRSRDNLVRRSWSLQFLGKLYRDSLGDQGDSLGQISNIL